MTTPDNPDWNELLKDIDMSGLGDPNKLINRVWTDRDPSQEQITIFNLTRAILRPYEDYFHEQATDFATANPLPHGTKKDWLRSRYHFMVSTTTGLHVHVDLGIQKVNQRWLAKYVGIDGNKLDFDSNGKITRVLIGPHAYMPRAIRFKALFWNEVHIPDRDWHEFSFIINHALNMGVKYTYEDYARIQRDGCVPLKGWDNPNIFVNALGIALKTFNPLEN